MYIYLDTLVVVNTYISWLMISLTVRIFHIRCEISRQIVASFFGGISSLAILMPTNTTFLFLLSFFLKIVFCLISSLILFLRRGVSIKSFTLHSLSFVLLNMLFGGAVYLVQSLLRTPLIYINGFNCYFDISLFNLIFITGLVYISLLLFSYFSHGKTDNSHSYRVFLTVGDESYCLEGVSDTGNTVTDIFSGKPVVICTGCSSTLKTMSKITAVPYSTVNGEGLLYAFAPDSIYIENEEGTKKDVNALVAFTESGSKRAVFNPEILV